MALAPILDATLATSSLALAHIPDATLPTSSRALAHIPVAHIPDATLQMGLCGVGWGGVGWGGLRTFNGTSTHTWCYATDLVSCTCTHTCYATDLVSCTCTHTNGNGAGKTVPVPIWAVWQPRLFERTCSESAAPEKKRKSPIFLFSPCGETQIHQKTRHPETASFYSWRSQKRANTSEKWWINKTQWN